VSVFYLTPKKAFIFAKKPFGSGAGACSGGGGAASVGCGGRFSAATEGG